MKPIGHSAFSLLLHLLLPLRALAAPSPSLHAFETRFHSLLPRTSDQHQSARLARRSSSGSTPPIRLVGFKRVPVPPHEVAEFEARWNSNPLEWEERAVADDSYNYFSHLWYDAPARELRVYFPVAGGLVAHSGSGNDGSNLLEADEWGQLPPWVRPADIAGPGGCPPSVMGRYRTANVTGVPGNVIKDGVIYLADPPEAVRAHEEGDVYVFDFGVKMVHDHSHSHSHSHANLELDLLRSRGRRTVTAADNSLDLEKRRLVPQSDASDGGNDDEAGEDDGDGDDPGDGGGCLANHGGINCSKAYGISEGRCDMDPSTCMDYNGFVTDCKKGTTEVFGIPTISKVVKFVGSDCSVSVARGHCFNELM